MLRDCPPHVFGPLCPPPPPPRGLTFQDRAGQPSITTPRPPSPADFQRKPRSAAHPPRHFVSTPENCYNNRKTTHLISHNQLRRHLSSSLGNKGPSSARRNQRTAPPAGRSRMLMQLPPSGLVHHARKVIHQGPPSHYQMQEFARKNAANFLSLVNLLMGLGSILCNLNGYRQWSCWLLLIGFMLDLADGAVARQLNTCSALGAKLDDFADFTSFGLATALLLHGNGAMDELLVMVYVLAVFTRLCFYASGIPFMYRGLPCPYASAILSCASLLTGGHPLVLRAIAVIMILFMIDQGIYPHDKILESQAWKKMVFAGGVFMMLCSFTPLACLYHLVWSMSYILFPEALWSFKV